MRDAAERAALGASLRIDELHRIARSVNVALAAREALATSAVAKQLRALLEPIDPALAPVATAIDSAVEEDGSDLRDNASPLLRKLRAELRRGTSPSSRGADEARPLELASRFPAGDIHHRARRPAGAGREDRRTQQGAGDRARCVELGTDALRRAARSRRAQQRARRGGGRRAGRGRADRPRALGADRRAGRRTCGARGGDRRGRPCARSRRSRDAGAARRFESPTRFGWSDAASLLDPARRSRSTSISAKCARSSSAGRTPAGRRWR